MLPSCRTPWMIDWWSNFSRYPVVICHVWFQTALVIPGGSGISAPVGWGGYIAGKMRWGILSTKDSIDKWSWLKHQQGRIMRWSCEACVNPKRMFNMRRSYRRKRMKEEIFNLRVVVFQRKITGNWNVAPVFRICHTVWFLWLQGPRTVLPRFSYFSEDRECQRGESIECVSTKQWVN